MTPLFEHYEQEYAWSKLSPKPVLIDNDKCIWFGMFMHQRYAFAIAASIFLNIPITPRQKELMWDAQFDVFHELKSKRIELPFKMSDFTHDGLLRYLHSCIYTALKCDDGILQAWKQNPKEIFDYFLRNQ
jgi:hypothetical protein